MTSDAHVAVEETDGDSDSDGGMAHAVTRRSSLALMTGAWLVAAMALVALVLALAFQTHPVADIAVGDNDTGWHARA